MTDRVGDRAIAAWAEHHPDDTCGRMAREIQDRRATCVWAHDDTHGKWDTDCGHAFVTLDYDGLEENGFRCCIYCGKRIKAVNDDDN